MINKLNHTFFSTDLAQDELENILRRIDENLALRPLFHGQLDVADQMVLGAAPPLPDAIDLSVRVQHLQQQRAPLFFVGERGLRNLAKRLVNLPIRLWGRKQIYFNRELLDIMSLLLIPLQGLPQYAEYQARMGRVVAQQQQQLQALQETVQRLADQLNQYSAEFGQQHEELRKLRELIAMLDEQLKQQRAEHRAR